MVEPEVDIPLYSAAEIRAMSPEVADQNLPVRIRGVVLQGIRFHPNALILWDGSEAVYVELPRDIGHGLKHGDRLEIGGKVSAGNFAPVVQGETIRFLSEAVIPTPIQTSVSEIAAGGFDAAWVEVEGVVRSSQKLNLEDFEASSRRFPVEKFDDYPIWILEIVAGDSRLQVRLEANVEASDLVDAKIKFQGVCYSVHNANRQFVRATLVVLGDEFLEVVVPAPTVADLPVTPVEELLRFRQEGLSGHRVRVHGIVTHFEPGRALWIRDGERGLEVTTGQSSAVSAGEVVDVVGFAEHGSYAPWLSDAVFRRESQQEAPLPVRIANLAATVSHEADLVEVEGELMEVRESSEGYFLTMDWDGVSFQAVMVTNSQDAMKLDLAKGSRLQLTGICTRAPQTWAPQIGIWRVEDIQILLRSPSDIRVIAPGPWLTDRRVLLFLAISAGLLVIVIVAIIFSARRAIARRGVERQMAEAEFSAMLKERNRVARDIHDTLAQGLNAVSMQLELAKNASASEHGDSSGHVDTAHEIVRGCIAEARESIWNMRSHVLDQTDLPGALEIVLRQLGAAHAVLSRVEVEGKRRRLAPTIENDLLRIGQEAIANALKHAGATNVVVRVAFLPMRVRLSVLDDGCGFEPPAMTEVSSRFGLKGMQERTDQMPGILLIRRRAQGGTEVIVEWGQTDVDRKDASRTQTT